VNPPPGRISIPPGGCVFGHIASMTLVNTGLAGQAHHEDGSLEAGLAAAAALPS